MRPTVLPTTLPVLVTCGNLAAGFLALLLAVEGNFWWATVLVSVAAALDLLDGALARRLGAEDEFGRNLDSLADLVSFGVVPAALLYLSLPPGLPPGMIATSLVAALFYIVCGALRLARFPLVKNPLFFFGLPIPPAGLSLAWVSAAMPLPIASLALAFVLGALMISELPFPNPFKTLLRRKPQDTREAG